MTSENPPCTTLGSSEIYTVSQLNKEARSLLETAFPLVRVEGEISNIARPGSGHLYFTLKDQRAQIHCAMFRMRNRSLAFTPENGMLVVVRAHVSLYEGRGDFQLIIEQMEPAGDGALQRAFEMLKQHLARQGLFTADHKQPLPSLPRRIGLITSPTGAALHDMLTVLKRRFPAIPVILYPVPVQGTQAAVEIAGMINKACHRKECDVLLVARGGGSLEDLWAFNEEIVARAVYDCGIPIVTGIGHEIDTTIADLVADQRAPTPSAAAELVSPDRCEWQQSFEHFARRIQRRIQNHLNDEQRHLHWSSRRLQQQHPGRRLQQIGQRLDEMDQRLRRVHNIGLRQHRSRLAHTVVQLQHHIPIHRLQALAAGCASLAQRLSSAQRLLLEQRRMQCRSLSHALDTVSPLATLGRGYAIVARLPERDIVRSSRQLRAGDAIEAQLGHGRLLCNVAETLDD